jgi:hypothetical protein
VNIEGMSRMTLSLGIRKKFGSRYLIDIVIGFVRSGLAMRDANRTEQYTHCLFATVHHGEHGGSTTCYTMNRRQSRISMDTRQNDTLLEFETCKLLLHRSIPFAYVVLDPVKKKFLLANKHITKYVLYI